MPTKNKAYHSASQAPIKTCILDAKLRKFVIPIVYFLFIMIILVSCKKLVSIPEPVSTITTTEVFSTDAQANAAIAGIYSKMISNGPLFGSGSITIFSGMSSDELNTFIPAVDNWFQFQSNTLRSDNSVILGSFWTAAYSYIYSANSVISGISSSNAGALHDSVKVELIGEAKFIRAFCYFYLTNLFGDVPLALSIDFNQTALMSRTSKVLVYKQIIQDLIDAQTSLPSNFSAGLGERIRPNRWAATALLARVYLFTGDFERASLQSTVLINSGLFSLVNNLNNVFLKNSTEAIWQLSLNNNVYPYATAEAGQFIPSSGTSSPNNYILTSQLLSSFETGDQRKQAWVSNTNYTVNGITTTYYYPNKYKIRTGTSGNIIEYYMMLRLSEQYLIRAEAAANGAIGSVANAINDLNIVRSRAGLPNLSASLTQSQVLAAVAHERQIELFAEWGHRWLDLKRTSMASSVLNSIKTSWTTNAELYPIPISELQSDPNLTQNPGY